MTESIQEQNSAPHAPSSALSPLESFILDELEPRRAELNTWEPAKSHIELLLHTARGQRVHAQKIAGKGHRSFALSRAGVRIGGLEGPVTTLVSHQGMRASGSRELTRQYLALSGLPHLPARTFHISQEKAAAAFMERLGRPVSIRPSQPGTRGGSHTNLATLEQLSQAWDHAAAACANLPATRQHIDVEAFLPWYFLRSFVVGEEAVATVARVPLHVVGDGVQTTHQLAEQELQRRNSCQFLTPIKGTSASDLLDVLAAEPDTVLDRGELQLLTYEQSGQTGPGWSVDVTDRISSDLSALAINATWAFPGLGASAVNILSPALDSAEKAVVSDLDPEATVTEFRYPAFGTPRYPNLAIIQRISGSPVRPGEQGPR